jgi:peptide deformylase
MDTEKIEQSMITIMEAGMGIGIAANQVGFNQRVIVLKPKGQSPFALFNPEIISGNEEIIDEEGCLSFPNLFIKINRFKNITVKYLDKQAKDCTITLSGYDAKCVQHEIDHLDGITFTKRVSKLKLDLALKKQRKLDGRTK